MTKATTTQDQPQTDSFSAYGTYYNNYVVPTKISTRNQS